MYKGLLTIINLKKETKIGSEDSARSCLQAPVVYGSKTRIIKDLKEQKEVSTG